MAFAIQSKTYGCTNRRDIRANLAHVSRQIDGCMYMADVLFPAKLIALPEGGIQGYYDEHSRMDHKEVCEKIAISLPGEETDVLAEKAKQWGVYIIAQAKVVEPEISKSLFFNTAFIIDPQGKVIHKHRKSRVFTPEGSCTPADIKDIWDEKIGSGLDAYYPVADTPIGRIGTMICYEGYFCETGRMLALNGAEILYRASDLEFHANNGMWEVMNRAHAANNGCYVVAPNNGPKFYTTDETVPSMTGSTGSNSMIINYKGQIMCQVDKPHISWAAAVIDVDEVRTFRTKGMMSLLPHLPLELYSDLYSEAAKEYTWPLNVYKNNSPPLYPERKKFYKEMIKKMIDSGMYKDA